MNNKDSAEHRRLRENALKTVALEKWGPYLSERQWGTVREDYSADGDAWNYFPHDHARSRVYLWGEDGLGGISNYTQDICFAIALWNGKDPILKERMFGLNNHEGNHGEDVKELYYYLDNLPSHYYMKFLYKYPLNAYPYDELVEISKKMGRDLPEYEILDTGVFDGNEYVDVYIEYAKQNEEDIFIRISVHNRSDSAAQLTVLPTLWFYNRWQYGGLKNRPVMQLVDDQTVKIAHERAGTCYFYFQPAIHRWFTENETNKQKLFGKPNDFPLVKDAFHDALINHQHIDLLDHSTRGTKFSPVYELSLQPDEQKEIYCRISREQQPDPFATGFSQIFDLRKQEADEFYSVILREDLDAETKNILRQAYAGLLWNKQFYHFDVERWLSMGNEIDNTCDQRKAGRNSNWTTLKNQDVLSMPDNWEYPWYAAWDLAFHAICMAHIDPEYAKHQLLLLMREWYMNPEGQLPSYEWDFGAVNPPVHAFAALEIYRIEKEMKGEGSIAFLKQAFQKLIINFTWWVNRKDENGNNIFEGGFMGLDNIGIIDRNEHLDKDILLEQSDTTSWMGMYALNMMDIALELAAYDPSFEDMATKFYEHFVIIADALNDLDLWNKEDQFFYDVLDVRNDPIPLRIRSIVGLVPLFAVSLMSDERLTKMSDFSKRMLWYKNYREENKKYMPSEERSDTNAMLLSLVHADKLVSILERVLDEQEFLAPGGIRSLSKYYKDHPYTLKGTDHTYQISYAPAESPSGMFGGNSNWRGPVWMPINFLLIKSLRKYGAFYGDKLKVAYPTGSELKYTLTEIAVKLTARLLSIFIPDENGNRPLYSTYNPFYKKNGPDLLQFFEYFDGDTSKGLGASHQTGWTALLVNLLFRYATAPETQHSVVAGD